MWRINKQFIDNQKVLGKEFYFSHELWKEQTHEYLKGGNLPEWEVPDMITKYYTTTSALKMARGNK